MATWRCVPINTAFALRGSFVYPWILSVAVPKRGLQLRVLVGLSHRDQKQISEQGHIHHNTTYINTLSRTCSGMHNATTMENTVRTNFDHAIDCKGLHLVPGVTVAPTEMCKYHSLGS